MQQRKSGRPAGTDGYDFSYRMVVDARYTKVAKGKSRLCTLILTQTLIQLIGGICIVLTIASGKGMNALAVSSSVIGLLSLLFGELGRRRSRAGFLRVYIITSSISTLVSVFYLTSSNSSLEVIRNPSVWEKKKFELLETVVLIVGSLVQIFTTCIVVSLIGNMSPPKKAS